MNLDKLEKLADAAVKVNALSIQTGAHKELREALRQLRHTTPNERSSPAAKRSGAA